MTTFGARLDAAKRARGPLCAGIDPHASLLADWGLTDDVTGLERFTMTAVEALAGTAAAASGRLTVIRTSSEPACASSMH